MLIEKIPRYPIYYSIFGLIFLTLLMSFKIIFIKTVNIIRKLKNTEKKIVKPSRIKVLTNKILDGLYLIEKKSLEKLKENKIFSHFSYYCFYLFVSFRKEIDLFYWPVLIIPWIFSLIIFFIEISLGKFLLWTLYCFSLTFLIKRCLSLVIYLINQENDKLLKILRKENNITYFFDWTIYQDFAIISGIIQWNLYFKNQEIQNKKTITYLWNLFQTLSFLRVNSKLISQFMKSHIFFWNDFTQKFHIVCLFLILCIKTSFFTLVQETSEYYEILFVFLFFGCTFVIFLIFLRFLWTLTVFTEQDWQKFSTSQEILNHFLHSQECFTHFLLEKHNFLKINDLKGSFFETFEQFPEKYFNQDFQEYRLAIYSLLSPEDKIVLDKLGDEFVEWFSLNEANIDIKNFKLNK